MSGKIEKKSVRILTNKENQTFNAYRKIINFGMSKQNNSFASKEIEKFSMGSLLDEVKNTRLRTPFCCQEKRFVWQDNNYRNKNLNAIELKGTQLIKPKIEHSINHFESFYDIKKELPIDEHKKKVYLNSANSKKILESLISSRVINPNLNVKKY